MDWSCPPWMDWFHGGLQFQIEHHIFPRAPRHRLRAISKVCTPLAVCRPRAALMGSIPVPLQQGHALQALLGGCE